MAALTALQRLMASPKKARFVETLRHADLPTGWADDPEIVSMAGDAYRELGTGSPFFKAWYGSQQYFQPEVLYHGTRKKGLDVLDPTKSRRDNVSLWLTDNKDVAGTYGKNIYDVYARRGENPLQVDMDGASWGDLRNAKIYNNADGGLSSWTVGNLFSDRDAYTDALAKKVFSGTGFDGLAFHNAVDVGKGTKKGVDYMASNYVIPDATDIKSVNNRGTFNPADPNIYRGLIPMLAGGGALAAMSPGSAQASEAQAEWPKQAPDGRLVWPADMPGYRNTEPGLEAPLVDPVDIATAPIGMTTAAGKALAMAAEPGLAYGTDKALGALLGMFQRRRSTGGGGGV